MVFDSYYCHAMPGWLEKTVGYHVDDGKVFEEGCSALGREVKGNQAFISLFHLCNCFAN